MRKKRAYFRCVPDALYPEEKNNIIFNFYGMVSKLLYFMEKELDVERKDLWVSGSKSVIWFKSYSKWCWTCHSNFSLSFYQYKWNFLSFGHITSIYWPIPKECLKKLPIIFHCTLKLSKIQPTKATNFRYHYKNLPRSQFFH